MTLIYVDWVNGTESIQHNSEVFKSILQWVNTQKQISGSTEQNVVLGQSMGGLVSRYTLAQMERDSIAHDVRLFIAHDSPMQGANTPLSIQNFMRHMNDEYVAAPVLYGIMEYALPAMTNFYNYMATHFFFDTTTFPSVNSALTINDTPAAMQMSYHYLTTASEPTMTVHQAWQEEFEAMGYPKQCRNVAISNGSECAEGQGFGPRDKLVDINNLKSINVFGDVLHEILTEIIGAATFDIQLQMLGTFPGSSNYRFDFEMRENPAIGEQDRLIYHGKIVYTKNLFFAFPITHTLTERTGYAQDGYLPYGTYSGGTYNILNSGIEDEIDNLNFPNSIVVHQHFGFIPVVSALDIKRDEHEVNPSDYLQRYAGGTVPEASLSTSFDNFIVDFTAGTNDPHISFNARNGNWLARELNGVEQLAPDCTFACNTPQIIGPASVCSKGTFTTSTGFDTVTWTISPYNAGTIISGFDTNEITIQFNTSYNGNITITAFLESAACGDIHITGHTWRGLPENATISGIANVAKHSLVSYMAGANGATSYNWTLPGSYHVVSAYNYNDANWELLSSESHNATIPAFTGVQGYSGNVTVQACNACGCSDTASMAVYSSNSGIGITPWEPEDPTAGFYYRVAPNPSSTYVHVFINNESMLPATGATVTGNLYDYTGLLKGRVDIINNEATIDVSTFSKGIYALVITVDGSSETHLIMVN